MQEIMVLPIEKLRVDETYQRQLDVKRVARLSKAFQSGACKAISVSLRPDGEMYVYDGQHTVEVLRALGIKECPALVVRGDQQQEARWFMLLNGAGARKATARESHHAAIVAEDATAIEVQDLLDEYGILVAKGGSKGGTTSSIGSLKIWCKADKPRLVRAMNAIDRLWCIEDHAWSQIIIRGMFDVAGDVALIDSVERGLAKHKINPRRVLDVAAGMQASTGATGGGSAYCKSALLQLAKVRA